MEHFFARFVFCWVCVTMATNARLLSFLELKKGEKAFNEHATQQADDDAMASGAFPPPPYITPLHLRSTVRKLLPWQQRRSPTAGVVLMLLFPSFLNNTFPSFVKGCTKRGRQSWLKHASCNCNVNYFSVMQTWGPFHNGQLMITLIRFDSKF